MDTEMILWTPCILCLVTSLHADIPPQSLEQDPCLSYPHKYEHQIDNSGKKINCFCCRPGFKRTSHCKSDNESAGCKRCPENEYSLFYNQAVTCQPCLQTCKQKFSHLIKNCTKEQDIQCECDEGYFNETKSVSEFYCKPHSLCKAGTYRHQKGSKKNDTGCQPCPNGTFTNMENMNEACTNCTTCITASYILQSCTPTSDTQCMNEDGDRDGIGEKSGLTGGEVAAIVIAVIFVFIVVVFIILCVRKYHSCKGFLRAFTSSRSHGDGINLEDPGFTGVDIPEKAQKPYDPVIAPSSATIPVMPGNQHEYALVPEYPQDQPTSGRKRAEVELRWTDLISYLSNSLPIAEWKFVIRSLFGKINRNGDRVIDEEIENHPNNVKEQMYNCLRQFTEKTDMFKFDLQVLLDVLEDCNLVELAEDIKNQEKFRILFLHVNVPEDISATERNC